MFLKFLIPIILSVLVSLPSYCYATVFEYGQNGEVTIHAAHENTRLSKDRSVKSQNYKSSHIPIKSKKSLYSEYIDEISLKYKVNSELIHAVIHAESAYNPNAISSKGAQGLMQLMPETAAELGVRDSFSPEDNIQGGTKYLRFLLDRYKGDTRLALAAYNAGYRSVDRFGDIPPFPETKAYVQRVFDYLRGAVK